MHAKGNGRNGVQRFTVVQFSALGEARLEAAD